MAQKEIRERTQLLDKKGCVASAGYSKHLNFLYDKKKIKSNPLSVKEWDFYQIVSGDKVLQMTIGHVSYCSQVAATLFNMSTGEKRSVGKLTAFPVKLKNSMENDGESPHVLQLLKKGFFIRFEVTESYRRLSLSVSEAGGVVAEADVTLTNCSVSKEKAVVAIPFERNKRFYLNYKENCYAAGGYVRIKDMSATFSPEKDFGLLDWGRGVWPFKHSWVWGNGSTKVDGKYFGFNIGWGFGDTSAANENMFFYDNKAYKLGTVTETESEKLNEKHYTDDEGLFDFTVKPFYDNFTTTRILFVDNSCHQVFGCWSGKVRIEGKVVEVPPFTAFCEHAKNRW